PGGNRHLLLSKQVSIAVENWTRQSAVHRAQAGNYRQSSEGEAGEDTGPDKQDRDGTAGKIAHRIAPSATSRTFDQDGRSVLLRVWICAVRPGTIHAGGICICATGKLKRRPYFVLCAKNIVIKDGQLSLDAESVRFDDARLSTGSVVAKYLPSADQAL